MQNAEMLTADEVALLLAGKIIHAIKEHRTRTGYGLRESKAVVDAYATRLGMRVEYACESCNGTGKTSRMIDGYFEFRPN
jgi:ribosomal protein L7/L12